RRSKPPRDVRRCRFVFWGSGGHQFPPTFRAPPAVPCTSAAQCKTAPNTKCRQRNPGAFGQGPARTITESGSPAGACIADQAQHNSTLSSVFCIPPAFNSTVDSAADLPGPGAVALIGQAQLVP